MLASGQSRLHPDWSIHESPQQGTFWWNASTDVKQWERPPFLFTPHAAVAAGTAVLVASAYDQAPVSCSFPGGCQVGEWHSIPAPAAAPGTDRTGIGTVDPSALLHQRQQQCAQQYAQQAEQRALMQQQRQRQLQLQRQQAAAEAERLQEEMEYQADDPDSDLANAADVEIYESYVPQKLKIGNPHPDAVVEAACLSTVASPDISLELRIHCEKHKAATSLSALQLEAVTYACQRYELTLQDGCRAGFFIGDGAGMGKGREIAGLLAENYIQGRTKSLWISISSDLKVDAERDLGDCGISTDDVEVVALNKCPYGKLKLDEETVLFTTYASLVAKKQGGGRKKNRSRLDQIVSWLGDDFDGCIVFDECHKGKNLIPSAGGVASRTGMAVVELQERLPKARVLYCSATGASEPRNMGYMVRLGLWGKGTAYPEGFKDFLTALERRGVGAMELLAMEMKRMGLYVSRTLSYAGSSFTMNEEKLQTDQQEMYDSAVRFLQKMRHEVAAASDHAMAAAAVPTEVVDDELDSESDSDEEAGLAGKAVWRYYWGQHQRFFMSLCAAMKVPSVVRAAKLALSEKKCIIIGMQSTGEASTKQALEDIDGDDLDDFISAPAVILERLIEKTYALPPKPLALKLEEREERMQERLKMRQEEAATRDARSARNGRQAARAVTYTEAESGDDDFESEPEEDDFSDEDSDGSDEDDDSSDEGDDEDGEEKEDHREKKRKNAEDEAKAEAAAAAAKDAYERALATKMALLAEARALKLPANPLDELIDQLGGVSSVAEMTGRSGRLVRVPPAASKRSSESHETSAKRMKAADAGPAPPLPPPDTATGGVRYEKRNADGGSMETANLRERDAFNNGKKNVAIISDAASAGISLHADRRFKNQRRRVHITLELPWSADKAVQQLGRSHRSNQVQPPEYIFCFTEIGGERRVASAVAKRLQSLGALTHGDRRATAGGSVSSLEAYNWDTKQGRDALAHMYRCVAGQVKPIVQPPTLAAQGDEQPLQFLTVARAWLKEVGLEKEAEGGGSGKAADQMLKEMGRFLNRILGLEVAQQDSVLEFFVLIYEYKLREARRDGASDECVFEQTGRHVRRTADDIVFRCPMTHAETRHLTFEIDRGISWEEAAATLKTAKEGDTFKGAMDGFYQMNRKGTNHVILVIECALAPGQSAKARSKTARTIRLFRPSTGEHANQAGYIRSRYTRVDAPKAKEMWDSIFTTTATCCMHGAKCKIGKACEAGKRLKTVHLLAGSTLPLWATVEQVLRDQARIRTFSVVRVIQTEALKDEPAEETEMQEEPKSKSDAKGKIKGKGSAGTADEESAAAAAEDGSAEESPTVSEKVIGINLPVKHAAAILAAISAQDGGAVDLS